MGIEGASALYDFLGFQTDFHDANLLDFQISFGGQAELVIHTWRMTSETDDKGYFLLDRHCVVTLACRGLTKVDLDGLGEGTIILSLRLEALADGSTMIEIFPVIGLGGRIFASKVSLSFTEGRPTT